MAKNKSTIAKEPNQGKFFLLRKLEKGLVGKNENLKPAHSG
jgi:hypothetical protein